MTDESRDTDETGIDAGLARPGGLSYLHIPAEDPSAAARFYAAVFEWQVRDVDSARPSFSDRTGHVAGAWVRDQVVSAEPGLLPYVYVSDIDDAAARIQANAGTLVEPPHAEGNLRVATFRDPSGNVLGIWQAS
jgi:predicted enzyme related to lactoylglutathione lyase